MFEQNNIKKVRKNIRKLEKCCDTAQDNACEIAEAAGKEVRKVYDDATQQALHLAGNLENEMRKNPLQYGLMALGLGFLAGALFRTRPK